MPIPTSTNAVAAAKHRRHVGTVWRAGGGRMFGWWRMRTLANSAGQRFPEGAMLDLEQIPKSRSEVIRATRPCHLIAFDVFVEVVVFGELADVQLLPAELPGASITRVRVPRLKGYATTTLDHRHARR